VNGPPPCVCCPLRVNGPPICVCGP
jgi:hypothetical protein